MKITQGADWHKYAFPSSIQEIRIVNVASFLGSVGTVIGLIRAAPQLIRLLRTREAYGVSLDTAATSSIVSFGWAAYGILTNQPYHFAVSSKSNALARAVLKSGCIKGETL